MRKLLVTCQCGQQMQVPRSAIGKMGMCPTCGQATRISTGNTRPLPNYGKGPAVHTGTSKRRAAWSENYSEPPEDAKQKFGQAVDHYYAGRYAESLAIFDSLAKEFAGNPDIEHGREQCLKAMKRPVLAAPDNLSGPRVVVQGQLDEETVRRVVLEKLLNGSSDDVQLKAAEIACKYLKLDASKSENVVDTATPDENAAMDEFSAAGNGHEPPADDERVHRPEVEVFASKKEATKREASNG